MPVSRTRKRPPAGRSRDPRVTLLVWRFMWVLSFIGAMVVALPAFLFSVYDISGSGEDTYGIDYDAVAAMRLFLCISCIPAIAAVLLPVKSWILRLSACGVVSIVAIRFIELLNL